MSGHRVAHDLAKAPLQIPDPGDDGTIIIDRQHGFVSMETGASSENRALADPVRAGIRCSLFLKSHGGGDVQVTATNGLDGAANQQAVFEDQGDMLDLVSVPQESAGGYMWQILTNIGGVDIP